MFAYFSDRRIDVRFFTLFFLILKFFKFLFKFIKFCCVFLKFSIKSIIGTHELIIFSCDKDAYYSINYVAAQFEESTIHGVHKHIPTP